MTLLECGRSFPSVHLEKVDSLASATSTSVTMVHNSTYQVNIMRISDCILITLIENDYY